jgi:hypothetical protein
MTQIMLAGKIYRMRPVGKQTFAEGYFQDNCFFEGSSYYVGDVASDGVFFIESICQMALQNSRTMSQAALLA